MKKISVITVTCNAEKTLPACFEVKATIARMRHPKLDHSLVPEGLAVV